MNRIFFISLFSILTLNVMAQEKIVQTAGRDQLEPNSASSHPNSRNSTTTSSSAKCGAAPTASACATAVW